MPRKAAAASGETGARTLEPRRSSRIKDLPRPVPVTRKAPAKSRAKKADKEKHGGEEEQTEELTFARGVKRKEPDNAEGNGAAPENGDEPAAKKVRILYARWISTLTLFTG